MVGTTSSRSLSGGHCSGTNEAFLALSLGTRDVNHPPGGMFAVPSRDTETVILVHCRCHIAGNPRRLEGCSLSSCVPSIRGNGLLERGYQNAVDGSI